MRWSILATAVAGLLGVVAGQEGEAKKQEKLKWDISGAKLVTAKKGDTAPNFSEEYVRIFNHHSSPCSEKMSGELRTTDGFQ